MKDRLTFILAVLMVALAVFVTVQLIDSQAAQRGRVDVPQVTQTVTPTETSQSNWPACEDTAPGQACQMYDDFDGDGTNTLGFFPNGM